MYAYMNEQIIAHSRKSFIYAYVFHALLNNEGEGIHCSWGLKFGFRCLNTMSISKFVFNG